MRTLDLTPLYRSTVGFDRLASMLDQVMTHDGSTSSYPPYNIEKTGDNAYRISLAVAGFAESDLEIEVKEGQLTVKASRRDTDEADNRIYLHRGIAERGFERRFQLAEHVQVTGANLDLGLLHIDLVREVPEALKPRVIKIAEPGERKAIKA
ncbi:Hsp20 family protein [Rhodobacteraceae bacterium NNCM2]|nr:Hsp20 family protein [Coraliihabitans acroporae]